MKGAGVKKALVIGVILLLGMGACTEPLEEIGIQNDASGGGQRPTTLSWNPPTEYADGTPLDPSSEILQYEIFVGPSKDFDLQAIPSAVVEGGNSNSFDLRETGQSPDFYPLWVTMRSVSVEEVKSDFAAPIEWR
jgi:hypothetical protein